MLLNVELVEDAWVLVAGHLDSRAVARFACVTSRSLRESIATRLCRERFPTLKGASPTLLTVACLITQTHDGKRQDLLRLLGYDTRMYARATDERGNKIDGEMRLYKVNVVDFDSGMYRYSNGARVVGERTMHSVCLHRIFVVARDVAPEYDDADCFDDDGARHCMLRQRGRFSDASDRALLDDLRPVFGFIDNGKVIARSAQCVVVNPRLIETILPDNDVPVRTVHDDSVSQNER